MHRDASIKNIVDIIATLLQTIILAVIPVVLEGCKIWQIVAYILMFVAHIIFMFLIREELIKFLTLSLAIDIRKYREDTVVEIFKNKILPNSFEIKKFNSENDDFDKYYLFLKWKETAELVCVYFTPDFINKKLSRKKEVSFSRNKIYQKEVQMVVEILTQTYDSNKKFKDTINDYKCKTFCKDINDLYNNLLSIKRHIN